MLQGKPHISQNPTTQGHQQHFFNKKELIAKIVEEAHILPEVEKEIYGLCSGLDVPVAYKIFRNYLIIYVKYLNSSEQVKTVEFVFKCSPLKSG